MFRSGLDSFIKKVNIYQCENRKFHLTEVKWKSLSCKMLNSPNASAVTKKHEKKKDWMHFSA